MATITGTRAASTFPVSGQGMGGKLNVAYGSKTITANSDLAAGNIIELCRVPKGAVILGGKFTMTKMESATTLKLDLDVGYAGATAALGNFGALSAAAVTNYKPETTGTVVPLGGLLLTTGPITTTAETVIQVTSVASARTFTTGGGVITVTVEYMMP